MAVDLNARKAVATNDGVTLRYIEAGQGRPLVMIPGWSQTAAEADIYEESQGGGHFMFIENPARFNAGVIRFLGG